MALTLEDLLPIARRYWRADKLDTSRSDTSPEHERLGALWEKELSAVGRWRAFLDELKRALPALTIGNATATTDASFRCAVYSHARDSPETSRLIVVGCVSIIAPVYTVYGVEYERIQGRRHNPRVCFEPLPARMRHVADVVASKIEETVSVRALPPEVARTPVPLYVEPVEPPSTTLFHALFTSEPASLPQPHGSR